MLPDKSTLLKSRMRNFPPDFKDELVIAKFKRCKPGNRPQTESVPVRNKETEMILCNQDNQPLGIRKGEVIGCLDMRSTGYYHVTRYNIEYSKINECS